MLFKSKKASVADTISLNQSRLLTVNNDFYLVEAYKSLRTNVMFSLTEETKNHVIMITSSMPGEGKSTTSANLAISLAQAGKRTLLIDCDMRKPNVGRLFKIKNEDGLSNALFAAEDCTSSITKIKDLELYIMTSGSIPPNPSELLGSKRMAMLVNSLREQFDYIILDTPPINVVTDATVLSPIIDGTLLVIRSESTERKSAQHAIAQLNITNSKLLGVVLNDLNMQGSYYGRSTYYKKSSGYGYGYSYSEQDSEQN